MTTVILAIPFLAVIVACVIVAKTRPWIRIVALFLAISLFGYIGYGLGIGIERGRFMSSHLHWFTKYSAHLNTLAEHGKDDELEATIKEFDARFQADPWSTTNIQAIMYQILQNRVPTQPAGLSRRMKDIIIPEVAFTNAGLQDVVKFLVDASVRYDFSENPPTRKGVNIVLDAAQTEACKISFCARDISLYEAIRSVSDIANLEWSIKQGLVVMEARRCQAKPQQSPTNFAPSAE